jgi:hypothetical protein
MQKRGLDPFDKSAAKTAITVKWLLRYAMLTALLIVLISTYAFAGRQILSARDLALTQLNQLNDKIELAQRQGDGKIVNSAMYDYLQQARSQNIERSKQLIKSAYPAKYLNKTNAQADANELRSDGKFFLCDNIDVTQYIPPDNFHGNIDIGIPSIGPFPSGRYY